MPNQNKAFEFGPFRLEVRERRLTRDGHSVPLRGRVFDTLYALVSRHGCLVTKDELMAIIWPDNIVEESNLNHNISVLRHALGEKATGQKYVETVPRQGYRFVADVRELDSLEGADLPRTWNIQETLSPGGDSRVHIKISTDAPVSPAEKTASSPTLPAVNQVRWYRHQGVVSSLAGALLLIVGYFGFEQLGFVGTPSNSRIMVAVLPFENLTGDSGQNYVADGLTQEVIAQLGRLNTSKVGVIASTSTRIYRNAQKSITDIGRELGVSYVVEGSLRRNQSSYRITVMLIQVENQSHLWAANYNRPVGRVTNLQEEIARIITIEIGRRIDANPAGGSRAAYSRGLGGLKTIPAAQPTVNSH